MSAPTSLLIAGQYHNYSSTPTQDKDNNNNNNNNKMSAIITSTRNTPTSFPSDLIENKFNELAKRILDELKQTTTRSDFFQAIDQILSEPNVKRHDVQARKLLLQARRSRQQAKRLQNDNLLAAQQQQINKLASAAASGASTSITRSSSGDTDALKKQCDMIQERQRQQQEQLDSHQQILFDSQYRSLPSEITQAVAGHEQRRANHKAATASAAAASQKQQHTVASGVTTSASRSSILNGSSPTGAAAAAATTTTRQLSSDTSKTSPIKTQQNLSPKKGGGVGVVNSSSSSSISGIRQRSAIPQSTILSGIQQTAYPLAKSATTTAATSTTTSAIGTDKRAAHQQQEGLVRQASLKINKQTREAQRDFIKRHTASSLSASEKLRQRRPTKASIAGGRQQQHQQVTSDDSDLDDDDDDDDDDDEDFEYEDLAARRAYLNHRFINQHQQQPALTSKQPKTDRTDERRSPNQQQHQPQPQQETRTINPASQVAKQKQRFSGGAPIVRSSTIGAPIGGGQRPVVSTSSRPTSRSNNYDDDHTARTASPLDGASGSQRQEPRSLNGLLTSHDIGQLYKPHMNYSTSLLGNHRLSDDDEIIIIPTAQSPSLLSASVSPDPRHHSNQQAYNRPAGDQPDQSTNNMDEFSERFSISRTKSFWEKLANSKKAAHGGGDIGHNQQQQQQQQNFNSSIRSIASSGGGGPNLVAVDTKLSQSSLLNAHENHMHDLKQATSGNYSAAAMKSAFDRMDSTGGSGNSHYSGCSSTSSSTSGDEQTATTTTTSTTTTSGYGRLQPKREGGGTSRGAGTGGGGGGGAKVNPSINQLIRQDELSRSDRFRQTR